ncbi:MAG: porin [Gemmataceae bacterium]
MFLSAAFARGGRRAAAAILSLGALSVSASAQAPPPIAGKPISDPAVVPASMPYTAPAVVPPLVPAGASEPVPAVPTTPVNVPPTPAKPAPIPMEALPSLDPMYAASPSGGTGAPGAPLDLRTAGRGPRGSDYDSKNISVFLGGRAQLDAVDFITTSTLRAAVPGTNPLNPGVSFRRLRLDASGSIYSHIDYLFQIDFVNAVGYANTPGQSVSTDVAVPTDAWVQFKEVPIVGNIKVGNHKPYYSFEHLTSSRYLNFMERSLGFDAFAEGFNNGFEPGISAFDTYLDKRGTWAVGVFKNTRNAFAFNVGRNETDVNGRVTFLPLYEEEGKYLLHMGLGMSQRDPDNGQVRFRSRFDMRNAPSGIAPLMADTGLFNASQQYLLVPELVGVFGPLSFQSEYYGSWVTGAETITSRCRDSAGQRVPAIVVCGGPTCSSPGSTGAYSRNSGTFGASEAAPAGGVDARRVRRLGRWQLTARYSYLDLNNKMVIGGRVNDLTLGVNWFLNQWMKMQTNFFAADRDVANPAGTGGIYGFGTRFALDW